MQTCLTGRLGRARRRFLGNILLCALALCCVARVHAQQSAGAVADTTANAPSKSQAKPSQSGYTGLVFGVKATRTAANTFVADYPTVGHVDPGSPAAKAGIKAGDEIVSVNGVDTRVKHVGLFTAGIKYELRLRRGNDELDVELVPTQRVDKGDGAGES